MPRFFCLLMSGSIILFKGDDRQSRYSTPCMIHFFNGAPHLLKLVNGTSFIRTTALRNQASIGIQQTLAFQHRVFTMLNGSCYQRFYCSIFWCCEIIYLCFYLKKLKPVKGAVFGYNNGRNSVYLPFNQPNSASFELLLSIIASVPVISLHEYVCRLF